MPWAFQGISTLSSALDAFQTQLDVTGQNISNVSTPGYTEETANLAEAPPNTVYDGAPIQLGNGVTVSSVTRIQANYLQGATYQAASDLGMANAQANTASGVNGVILDPNSGGISSDLSAFFNAWSGLASDPSSTADRLTVQQTGQTLSTDMQNAYSGLQQLQTSNTQQIQSTIESIQSDVNQIANLNQEILKAQAAGGSPNTLMDQRDQAVADLASKMNISVTNSPNGSVSVNSGNLILVDQDGARTVPTTYDASTGNLTDGKNSYHIQSGQLAGLFDSANKLSSYQSGLDTLADQLRTQVNTIYATAKDSSGKTGETFFNSETGAASLGLSSDVSGDPSSILTGTSGTASDGGVALSISNLANQNVAALGNTTLGGYYSSLVGQIGTDGQTANNAQSTQQAISQQVQAQVSSVTGVNLDDEMTNLLRFQRSYQAAAQALNVMDQTVEGFLTAVQM